MVEEKKVVQNRLPTELNSLEELWYIYIYIFGFFSCKKNLIDYLDIKINNQNYYNYLNGISIEGSKNFLLILKKLNIIKQDLFEEIRYFLLNLDKSINYLSKQIGINPILLGQFRDKKVDTLNTDHTIKICNYFNLSVLNIKIDGDSKELSYEKKIKKFIIPLALDHLIKAGADSAEWIQIVSNQQNKNNSTESLKNLKESVGGLKLHEGEVNIPQLETEEKLKETKFHEGSDNETSIEKRTLNFFEFCKKNLIKKASIEFEEGFKTYKISFEDNKKTSD